MQVETVTTDVQKAREEVLEAMWDVPRDRALKLTEVVEKVLEQEPIVQKPIEQEPPDLLLEEVVKAAEQEPLDRQQDLTHEQHDLVLDPIDR